jgi:hypothetical protein
LMMPHRAPANFTNCSRTPLSTRGEDAGGKRRMRDQTRAKPRGTA